MVSEKGMSSACADFTQNAWRKELCANCQRPRAEHVNGSIHQGTLLSASGSDSPKPAKRNSLMTKSWTAAMTTDDPEDEEEKWNSFCIPLESDGTDVKSKNTVSDTKPAEASSVESKGSIGDLSASGKNVKPKTESKPIVAEGDTRRSRSREQSPIPPAKPKFKEDLKAKKTDPVFSNNTTVKNEETVSDTSANVKTDSQNEKGQRSSAISKKEGERRSLSVTFLDTDATVIGIDGGYDNLFLDEENSVLGDDEDDFKEMMVFTEPEKEFLMLALKNTVWNSDPENFKKGGNKLRSSSQSREYEDLDVESLLRPDRFAQVRDCDPFPEPKVYGTFPMRAKSEKSAMDSIFVDSHRLSTLSESGESAYAEPIAEKGFSEYFKDLLKSGESKSGVKNLGGCEDLEPNYDDPWGDKFAFDTESEMNLLDEIRGEIDLDSSSAGMALVDLLNDVLSKYSTGTPSETDSVKNFDGTFDDEKLDSKEQSKEERKVSKDKPTDLEAKMVTLAANLRKQRAKRHAPRPPSVPPPPEPVMSPAKQLELRAAQSKEPTFKMVPIGKPIGGNPPLIDKPSVSSPKKSDPAPAPESIEGFRLKGEKEKSKKGGITSFFKSFLRRGRDSDSDISASNETIPSETHSDSEVSEKSSSLEKKGDKGSNSDRRNSKSSPQMRLKVLPPNRPVSPKPVLEKSLSSPAAKSSTSNGGNGTIATTDKNQSESSVSLDKSPKNASPSPKSKDVGQSIPSGNKSPEKADDTKDKEAPKLPRSGSKENQDFAAPKPRVRGNSDGGPPRMRTRENSDVTAPPRPRDTPNVPPPRPPIAAKPRQSVTKSSESIDASGKLSPPIVKRKSSTSSLDEDHDQNTKPTTDDRRASRDNQKRVDPAILRKRAKSPKRFAAPSAPSRASVPNLLSDSTASIASTTSDISTKSAPAKQTDGKPMSFTKELELKLNKNEPTSANDVKKMVAPPPPISPPAKSTVKEEASFKSFEEDKSKNPSPEVEKQDTSPPCRPVEKIELPKPAGSSRKSFLGKLNRKNRPPPPPSVKRTKSINEQSDKAEPLSTKKIDLKDISGPVLITDMSSTKVVNRRNTISLGDDSAFLSGGSTSSGSTAEKSENSPRGSVENLYELITPEAPAPPVNKRNFYDPVDQNKSLRPPSINSLSIEGYLEPVRSNTAANQQLESVPPLMTESMPNMIQSVMSIQEEEVAEVKVTHAQDDLDIAEERRRILASQPIYEEINGYGKLEPNINYNLKPDINVAKVEMIPTESEEDEAENERDFVENAPVSPSGLKSKDSFSSESDTSSATNSLSRPRPIPRRRPRQSQGSGFEQYVAMNRPSVAVFLNEEQLREILSKLTAMNLHTLREIYTQHEKAFTKESLHLGSAGPLKWHDFDIYGKPVHTSERCIVYNAKLKTTQSSCQVMLLHSRPEITPVNHPSLLKPTCIFTDTIPFTYLTEDFIATSQLLQNCGHCNTAKCYVVVGLFDITENLTNHVAAMQSCENQNEFLRKILFIILQLLSAITHCVEQSHPLAESDFRDIYLISNPHCQGDTVSFLPQQRSPENQQIDSVCLFLEKFLDDMCGRCEASSVLDDSAFFIFNGIQKIISMLQSGSMESFPMIRSYTEFILWGPGDGGVKFGDDRESNLEPKLSMWLEKQRADLIHNFARRIQHGARCMIEDFYCMKFLLKASSGSLAECIRCHTS